MMPATRRVVLLLSAAHWVTLVGCGDEPEKTRSQVSGSDAGPDAGVPADAAAAAAEGHSAEGGASAAKGDGASADCDAGTDACTCDDDCDDRGASECTDGRFRTCEPNAQGCLRFGAWVNCASGFCADGTQCGECPAACPEEGAAECEDGRIRYCAADDQGCVVWSDWVTCGSGACDGTAACADCQDSCGAVSAAECADGKQRTCAPNDGGCLEWGAWEACDSGFCADAAECGQCVNECATTGEQTCIEGQLRTCELDEHDCHTLGEAATPCPGGVCADALTCGFTVGGTIAGLDGELTLDAGGQSMQFTANGAFELDPLADETAYSLFVEEHPTGQQCSVSGGHGMLGGSNVSDIRIQCEGAPLGNLQLPIYLKAGNTGQGDGFGEVMAMDGDTLVIGASSEDGSATGVDGSDDDDAAASGAVYVFVRESSGWVQQAYLKASNSEGYDNFGRSVAIAGNTLAVGAPAEDSASVGVDGDETSNQSSNAGAVYVFVRQGTTWTQQAYIKASNTGVGDGFGSVVALTGEGDWFSSDASNDLLAVGAPVEASAATGIDGDQADNAAPYAGAVYLFRRDGTSWAQAAYVKASNAELYDSFGTQVALSGDTLAVGAMVEASASRGVDADQMDNFAPYAGAVYVFRRAEGSWYQEAYLKASNADGDDRFGAALALSGDLLAVGAAQEDGAGRGVDAADPDGTDNAAANSGAVYVFQRDGATWQQEAYLKSSNSDPGDAFGVSVALSGPTLVVGANGERSAGTGPFSDQSDNSAAVAGAAYVFERAPGGDWQQVGYLKAPNAAMADSFGSAVAAAGGMVAVGARGEDSAAVGVGVDMNDDSASNAGAAYVFEDCSAPSASCYPCDHRCPWPGATRCTDGDRYLCEADQNGCLDWGLPAACADGFCADAVTCGTCPFYCDPGTPTCHAGEAGTCATALDVCFDLTDTTVCPDGFCYDENVCAVMAYQVQWGSDAYDVVTGSALDANGNLFVAGTTAGDLDGTNAGGNDAFLTKLDATGAILWTRQWGTVETDSVSAVVVDAAGDVYVAGDTRGNLDGNTSSGSTDLFITKWTTDGTRLWTVQWGTTLPDSINDMVLSSSGTLLLTGTTYGALQGTKAGDPDPFAAEVSTDGVPLWTTQWGTERVVQLGLAVGAAADGSVYVAGMTEGDMGPGPVRGSRDAFLTKLDSSGVLQWTVQWGGDESDQARAVAVDAGGNIYVTGFADGVPNGFPGDQQVFLTKWDASGTELWTQKLGSPARDEGWDLAVAPNGDPLLVVRTEGALAGSSARAVDVALLRFTPDGVEQSSTQWGTTESDYVGSLSVDSAGTIHIVGWTYGPLTGSPPVGDADAFAFAITR